MPIPESPLFPSSPTICSALASCRVRKTPRRSIVSNGGLLSVSLENIPYADSIAWFLEDGFVGTGNEWAPNVDGSFTAEVFFDGCSAISPSFEAGAVDIEWLQPDDAFKLWPNPANESFTFQMPTPRPFGCLMPWDKPSGRASHPQEWPLKKPPFKSQQMNGPKAPTWCAPGQMHSSL